MRSAFVAALAALALAAAPASAARTLKETAAVAKPVSFKQGDSLPAITLPTMAEVQSFLASPEVKQVQSWIAEAPPLPKPAAPRAPPKREPKAKPAPHRPPHRGEAAAPQAAVDAAAPPADVAGPQQPVAEAKP